MSDIQASRGEGKGREKTSGTEDILLPLSPRSFKEKNQKP